MEIKVNSLNNAATKYLAHIPNIKTIKIIQNLWKRPNTANVHFHFPLRNLQPQTCGLIYKFHKEMHGHWKCWQRLRVYAFFTRKMSVNQLNIRGVCRCHASINLFGLRKILIVLFVTKQFQPFCVRTGGDALMKLPCSGLLPSIEVGLCYLRKWRRGKSLLFILKQAQSMWASVYSPSSTGQSSTVKW